MNNQENQLTADQLALAVAEKMLINDYHSQHLGVKIVSATANEASCSLTITKQHLNGHGNCHGGVIFSLADTAFANSCNAKNQVNVGVICNINYVYPALENDILIAKAIERGIHGRSGIYDVTVTNQNNKVIAEFRGHSRLIKNATII